jgi:ABC-type transporter Mla maintaining outer membrane lipid asymmetry ATPase subunit MlaF/ABC-type transporter Mla maintaining outer membrane lipid asymmetry permease subunit MlaE
MNEPFVRVHIFRESDACPFANKQVYFTVAEGECIWLEGPSGVGKSSIINHLSKLDVLRGARVDEVWDADIKSRNQVGVLFQQGVLVDSLSVGENIALSLEESGHKVNDKAIVDSLVSVGLQKNDRHKMPGELSGGMLRRAALAQILAQRKKLIILDEPFVGLDENSAFGIVKLLAELKKEGQSFLLITHEPHYAKPLVDKSADEVVLEVPRQRKASIMPKHCFHHKMSVRIIERIIDYVGISTPLIICAFIATGLAISLLFAQLLGKFDFQKMFMAYLHHAHLSWVQHVGVSLFKSQISHMGHHYMPIIKRKLYVMVLVQTFVAQLGPLLTALLLVGRIGASYTGEVAMMQATNQNQLLRTLGMNPRTWTLLPAFIAAVIAVPLLTYVGTAVALFMGAMISSYGANPVFLHTAGYWHMAYIQTFHSTSTWDNLIVMSAYRSLGFMVIILGVSELFARHKPSLQPREVPKVITWSVVIASLLILLADWGFTEIQMHL